MTDSEFAGPMSMIKIDGAKIKRLREQQGLTQLYLATAVEVTTDTISRWENRRYPSIKKENGLKLAEALSVDLGEILEDEKEDIDEVSSSENNSEEPATVTDTPRIRSGLRMSWPLLILSSTLFCVLIAFLWYALKSPTLASFSAERIVPPHAIAGQPFPVIIKVMGAPNDSTALILKESIPDNCTIHKTSPDIASSGMKNDTIKWLKKIKQSAMFAYIISVKGKEGDIINFTGTIANSNDAGSPINGISKTTVGFHHWADTDNDNVISDNEILAIYDQYSEIDDIDINIDLIEEIWLGSGYRWDKGKGTYEILE